MALLTEQLISFLGVDAAELELYAGGRYAVIQRDPQPNEIDISQNTGINLLMVDMEGTPVVLADLEFDFEVYVNSVLVLYSSAGSAVWQNGWDGTVEVAQDGDPFFFYKVFGEQVSPPLFTSEQVVPVQVVLDQGGPPLLDVTWSFTVEDIEPPSIVAAEAIDAHTVRVTFDDEMATEGPGSALLPGSYTVETQNIDPLPGVALEVTGVEAVPGSGSTQFDLTFQWEQTPACQYQITVDSAVTDSSGNPIA
jgi:hypothetical protein